MKHPLKWKIYWLATKVRDWGIPVITPIADFIRDKTWEWEDHRD